MGAVQDWWLRLLCGRFVLQLECGRRRQNSPVAVVIDGLSSLSEAVLEVCSCAEDAAVARHHDAFDSVVEVEQLEGPFHLFHHGAREGIVLSWAI